jgi:16S rRNA processing protein RimM
MDYVEIGRVRKPHGLSGELKGDIDERFLDDVAEIDAFFVDIKGEKTPYFIDYLRGKGTLIMKFEDINTKEDASLFTSKALYLRRDDVNLSEEEINDTGLEFSYLEGYELHVEELGKFGTIEEVEEYPQQEMATVKQGEKSFLVPLRTAWILSVDEDKKIVVMDLPEGLLDFDEPEIVD